MTGPRNFVAEIKERESHQPCFLFISLHADIGRGTKNIVIQMAKGTGIAEAKALRDALHENASAFKLL
jgi:hypothetical protein